MGEVMAVKERISEFTQTYRKPLILYAVSFVLIYAALHVQFEAWGQLNFLVWSQLGLNIAVGVLAFMGAFLPFVFFKRFWPYIVLIGAIIYTAMVIYPMAGYTMAVVTGILAGVLGAAYAMYKLWPAIEGLMPTTFGSSRWAKKADLEAKDLLSSEGIKLGSWNDPKDDYATHKLAYSGPRHLLTVAPTRAGKGVSAIIPNLLTYPGSALVIDPKGENALITAKARKAMGQEVMIVDPWGITDKALDMPKARFNPMDWLVEGDPDLSENAMLLADALVMPNERGDPYWDNEARALIYGLLMHLATEQEEVGNRNLGRLREILTLPPRDRNNPRETNEDDFDEVLANMVSNVHNKQVQSAAHRIKQKADKERSGVFSTAQSHTHFLESPRIIDALSKTDFSFDAMKNGHLTIYLILPADRLNTFGRWLRLMIQQAITQTARNITTQPKYPVLFLLDEMPALGHLKMVEQAYGLMAGFGMQLWGITQDLSQLKRIYGDGWETFVSNSGVLQYFGSRDQMTAEYFSKLCGVTTVWNVSTAISTVFGGNNSNSETKAQGQRSLAFADELMTLRSDQQILLVENAYPIKGIKTPWFNDPALKAKGVNLHEEK